jgi:hypothetical protein
MKGAGAPGRSTKVNYELSLPGSSCFFLLLLLPGAPAPFTSSLLATLIPEFLQRLQIEQILLA